MIACILPPPLSFTFSVAIVFLVAAIGAFALARELGCRESTAAIAAVGWTYCSSLALYVLWPHGCWAYLPLVLLATRRIVREPGVRSWALLTTSLTLLTLAGHPETVLHIVTLGGFYAMFELWASAVPEAASARPAQDIVQPAGSMSATRRSTRAIVLALAAGIVTLLLVRSISSR